MIHILFRKTRQVLREPAYIQWLIGRLLGRYPREPAFQSHRPDYLTGLLPLIMENPTTSLLELPPNFPKTAIDLPLAGLMVTLEPGQEKDLFTRRFDDIETLLSLHRFAWLPILGKGADPAWVNAIWSAWFATHSTIDDGWAWHPYTAAERAINILHYAESYGLPSPVKDTLKILAAHGPAIADRLEYFGEHHTSNHLANNGRGLLTLGLELGLPQATKIGARILIEESKRLFLPSGILREGSSHYHVLLANNFTTASRMARKHDHPIAEQLKKIADSAAAVVPRLSLPGGMPLIGDISPDIPPSVLMDRNALPAQVGPCNLSELCADGWLRYDHGPWSGLWHASNGGWSHMPGHGHQDCGSFEVHFEGISLFVDPGRGAYGESGEAALYRSAKMHNTLSVDGKDPYPANKPYFNDVFRRKISGPSPVFEVRENSVNLTHHGYARLRGVGSVKRVWLFDERSLSISDTVEGSATKPVGRTLCTTFNVTPEDNTLLLKDKCLSLRLSFEPGVRARVDQGTRWTAYGVGEPASYISVVSRVLLPWQGAIKVEKL